MEIINLIFSGFWHFIGAFLLIRLPFRFLYLVINRFYRTLNIKRKGWPPEHLDADGDFKRYEKEEQKDTKMGRLWNRVIS